MENRSLTLNTGRNMRGIDLPRQIGTLIDGYLEMQTVYKSAICEVSTKLEILNEEFNMRHRRNPIHHMQSRLKSPESILKKLMRKGLEASVDSARRNLTDIAGIRVVCCYIEDIYTVASLLEKQDDVTVLRVTDYIKNPKESGYRSLHLIADVTVHLSSGVQKARCEIQLRTIAMDSWATLEHQLRYKSKGTVSAEVANDLVKCSEMLFASDLKMQQIAETLGVFEQISRGPESIKFFR